MLQDIRETVYMKKEVDIFTFYDMEKKEAGKYGIITSRVGIK